MNERGQMQIIFHGGIILLAGVVCGVPFALAVGHGWGDEAVRAWRVAHTGAVSLGVALIAIGGIAPRLVLGNGAARVLLSSLLVAGYTFGIGVVMAAVTGVRGLAPTAPLNLVVFLVYITGTLATFVASSLLLSGAYASLQREGSV
jgi:hypothetical protein